MANQDCFYSNRDLELSKNACYQHIELDFEKKYEF